MSASSFYIFNEDGIIEASELDQFSLSLQKKLTSDFRVYSKKDIDEMSTIFKKFTSEDLRLVIYDYGYVMKIEGVIKSAILFLKQLDQILDPAIKYYVSPSQRVENSEETRFPRGANVFEIAKFLDRQFCNNDYSSALLA